MRFWLFHSSLQAACTWVLYPLNLQCLKKQSSMKLLLSRKHKKVDTLTALQERETTEEGMEKLMEIYFQSYKEKFIQRNELIVS